MIWRTEWSKICFFRQRGCNIFPFQVNAVNRRIQFLSRNILFKRGERCWLRNLARKVTIAHDNVPFRKRGVWIHHQDVKITIFLLIQDIVEETGSSCMRLCSTTASSSGLKLARETPSVSSIEWRNFFLSFFDLNLILRGLVSFLLIAPLGCF